MLSEIVSQHNPIDVVEELVVAQEWPFDRQGEEELAAQIPGDWCDYRLWFAWRPDLRSLHLSCAFDMKVPANRRVALYPLLAKINERLWIGHFELWSEEGCPAFRYTYLFDRDTPVRPEVLQEIVEAALAACERFYPAFQFVIWGGKSAEEAFEASLLDTVGEA